MACYQCDRLEEEFERLERAYGFAYGVLTARADITRADEYSKLKVAADEAWINLEVARLELEQHKRGHWEKQLI